MMFNIFKNYKKEYEAAKANYNYSNVIRIDLIDENRELKAKYEKLEADCKELCVLLVIKFWDI